MTALGTMTSELRLYLFCSSIQAPLDEMSLLSVVREDKALFEELHGSNIFNERLDPGEGQIFQ